MESKDGLTIRKTKVGAIFGMLMTSILKFTSVLKKADTLIKLAMSIIYFWDN